MKKSLILAIICVSILLGACSVTSSESRFKRINFSSDELGDEAMNLVDSSTTLIYNGSESFAATLPIYQITEAVITEQQILDTIKKIEEESSSELAKMNFLRTSDGKVSIDRVYQNNDPSEDFIISEEELERKAWQVLELITYLEGEYEYTGVYGISRITYPEDKAKTLSITVSFSKLLDGIRITGAERVLITFDIFGIASVFLDLYEYQKIGTMELVPITDAAKKIKSPDSLSVFPNEEKGSVEKIDKLQVERVKLLFVNQFYRGCTILQPIYNFIGTALDIDGDHVEFHSKVIAIPESYTYEDAESVYG